MISEKQRIWLNQMGGRDILDVVFIDGKPGIYMYRPSGVDNFYHIPSDSSLKMIQSVDRITLSGTPILRKIVVVV